MILINIDNYANPHQTHIILLSENSRPEINKNQCTPPTVIKTIRKRIEGFIGSVSYSPRRVAVAVAVAVAELCHVMEHDYLDRHLHRIGIKANPLCTLFNED